MSSKRQQRNLNRERVRRFRSRKTKENKVRTEVSLDEDLLSAIQKYQAEWDCGRSSAISSLLLSGLRVEGKLAAPEWFWDRVKARINCFR